MHPDKRDLGAAVAIICNEKGLVNEAQRSLLKKFEESWFYQDWDTLHSDHRDPLSAAIISGDDDLVGAMVEQRLMPVEFYHLMVAIQYDMAYALPPLFKALPLVDCNVRSVQEIVHAMIDFGGGQTGCSSAMRHLLFNTFDADMLNKTCALRHVVDRGDAFDENSIGLELLRHGADPAYKCSCHRVSAIELAEKQQAEGTFSLSTSVGTLDVLKKWRVNP